MLSRKKWPFLTPIPGPPIVKLADHEGSQSDRHYCVAGLAALPDGSRTEHPPCT